MSKAKKCDRCGKFYEKNVVIESKGSAFGDTIGGIKTVTKDGITDEAFDLCDDCVKTCMSGRKNRMWTVGGSPLVSDIQTTQEKYW